MYLNFPIASQPYQLNSDGLYSCPVCNSVLGKIFNVHNDNLYTLQCPVNREHCYRKNEITHEESLYYSPIKAIKQCTVCNSILVYNKNFDLVCPNNATHVQPIKTSISEIEKLGYLPLTEYRY